MPFHLVWTPRPLSATDLAILVWFVTVVLAVWVLGWATTKGERE